MVKFSTGGTQVTNASTVTIAEDHTLYAHWLAKYDCKCNNCTNKVSTYNAYCSTCSSYSKCSSSGSCTRHCTSTHYCKCNECSSTVSCNTSQCSTCNSYSECTSCYNCGYHYSICSDCGYCSSCGCTCDSSVGDTSCYCCGGAGGCHDTHVETITCGSCNIPAKAVSCTAGCWAYLDCVCVTIPDLASNPDMHNYDYTGKCEVCGR